MMNLTRKSQSTEVSGAAEEVLEATGHALERTRQFADHAINKAGQTARDLRYGASDLAHKGANTVSDAAVAAQRQLGHYSRVTRRYVADQPVKSALIAAAVGAAVAALVLAIRRNRQDS
jgi:ElaB/YqjD/DUF883 family membrane-anchored ribosome-binding protein